jgi:nicotinate-nucleotide pyrophosphorylase (carboxylating)
MRPSVPIPADLDRQVAAALAEDIGGGDRTAALIPADKTGRATVITREPTIVCGMPYVEETFRQLGGGATVTWSAAEGEPAAANQPVFRLEGNARTMLSAERTALNFLQLLSGTAAAAHAYAQRLEGTACRLLDTRKTIPGLRTAQKYAVRVGGGHNHRMGLFDGVLIKENHIMAAGSIAAAVTAARRGSGVPIEVEVENLEQLREAIDAGADIVMLDNFSLPGMRAGVAMNAAAGKPLKIEASGGIGLDSIREIALTGVDFISVGSITKHVRATDLSMRFDWASGEIGRREDP